MKSQAIQQQLDDVIASINDAEARRGAATTRLVNNPSDAEARNVVREASAYIRDMRDEKEALEFALAAAKVEDNSEATKQKRQDTRNMAVAAVTASKARIKKAAAVDKAVAQLRAALCDLVATNAETTSALSKYLPRAHAGNHLAHGDWREVLRDNARGFSYIVPALGRALGYAMDGLEMPNIPLRDWLHVNEGPCGPHTIEEAATLCSDRFVAQMDFHVGKFVGHEDDSHAADK